MLDGGQLGGMLGKRPGARGCQDAEMVVQDIGVGSLLSSRLGGHGRELVEAHAKQAWVPVGPANGKLKKRLACVVMHDVVQRTGLRANDAGRTGRASRGLIAARGCRGDGPVRRGASTMSGTGMVVGLALSVPRRRCDRMVLRDGHTAENMCLPRKDLWIEMDVKKDKHLSVLSRQTQPEEIRAASRQGKTDWVLHLRGVDGFYFCFCFLLRVLDAFWNACGGSTGQERDAGSHVLARFL